MTTFTKFLRLSNADIIKKINFSTSPTTLAAFKWRYVEKGNNATIGMCAGHPDDPIFHTNDIPYRGSTKKGDVLLPE